jgi:hypothetical protein
MTNTIEWDKQDCMHPAHPVHPVHHVHPCSGRVRDNVARDRVRQRAHLDNLPRSPCPQQGRALKKHQPQRDQRKEYPECVFSEVSVFSAADVARRPRRRDIRADAVEPARGAPSDLTRPQGKGTCSLAGRQPWWYGSPFTMVNARYICSRRTTRASSCGRVMGPSESFSSANASTSGPTP